MGRRAAAIAGLAEWAPRWVWERPVFALEACAELAADALADVPDAALPGRRRLGLAAGPVRDPGRARRGDAELRNGRAARRARPAGPGRPRARARGERALRRGSGSRARRGPRTGRTSPGRTGVRTPAPAEPSVESPKGRGRDSRKASRNALHARDNCPERRTASSSPPAQRAGPRAASAPPRSSVRSPTARRAPRCRAAPSGSTPRRSAARASRRAGPRTAGRGPCRSG